MKLSDRFYAIGNLEKKRPGIGYVPGLCSPPNKRAYYLQTICNPMLRLLSTKLRTFTGGNIRFN